MAQGVPGIMVNQNRTEEECDIFTATSGAMADSIAPGVPFQLLGFELAINTAPTTSENFTVTKNAGVDAAYDTVLYSNDLSDGSVTDIIYYFDPTLCPSVFNLIGEHQSSCFLSLFEYFYRL